jgi:hypothetical protein
MNTFTTTFNRLPKIVKLTIVTIGFAATIVIGGCGDASDVQGIANTAGLHSNPVNSTGGTDWAAKQFNDDCWAKGGTPENGTCIMQVK